MMNHMTDDSEFLSRLINFGLSEKEARTYFYLLKYGPKTVNMLEKSLKSAFNLKTYREDVYRTLDGLIDKGMVNPSLDSLPTVYAAVELESVLDGVIKKRESELRELEQQKQELLDLAQRQMLRPSDELHTHKIIKSVREATALIISTMPSWEERILWVAPGATAIPWLVSSNEFHMAAKKFVERGGRIRGICDITYPIIGAVQELLDIGVDVRHFSQYQGIYFVVFDSKLCWSSIDVDVTRTSPSELISMLQTDDPTHIKHLASTFEILWKQTIPAAERIEELLKEEPPKV